MNIVSITGVAICASIFALCVKQIKPEIGQLVTISAVIVILCFIVPSIADTIKSIQQFAAYTASGSKYIVPIFKITGIAYVSQIGSELCSDAGEKALAGRVEMAGKVAICIIAIPIAKEAFERIIGIL